MLRLADHTSIEERDTLNCKPTSVVCGQLNLGASPAGTTPPSNFLEKLLRRPNRRANAAATTRKR